jgi:ribonuclease HI
MAYKYYAVHVGREPGVFSDWDLCNHQVSGFPGCVFKGFNDYSCAEAFVEHGHEWREKINQEKAERVSE